MFYLGVIMKYFLLTVLMMTLLSSCSGKKKNQDEPVEGTDIDLSDANQSDDLGSKDDPLLAEGEENPLSDSPNLNAENDLANAASPAPTEDVAIATDTAAMSGTGGSKTYAVKKHETLMIIAFKLFGDYEKWRDLARWNSDVLRGQSNISEGMTLKYEQSGQEFVWNPEGNPYLIKRGVTLGVISNNVYGVQKYWKNIWDNNKPLIKSPHVIFAGFTIYTPVLDTRGVANQ